MVVKKKEKEKQERVQGRKEVLTRKWKSEGKEVAKKRKGIRNEDRGKRRREGRKYGGRKGR